MTRPFTQADITRACRGVIKAGLKVSGVNIGKNGDIQVLTVEDETAQSNPAPDLGGKVADWAEEYARKYAGNPQDN